MNKLILAALLAMLMCGCSYFSGSSEGEVVARVGNKALTREELSAMIPKGIPIPDSTARAEDIINTWVRQELMLQMAEEKLDVSQKDVQKELDEYRKSLIIHRYQQSLISSRMDTLVTEADLKQYYEQHPANFTLEQSIVKAIFIEVPRNVAKPAQIKRWLTSETENSRQELENYSFQYATKYDYFSDKWIEFARLKSRIPGFYEHSEDFLRRNRYFETTDVQNYYFLYVQEFRLQGEKAPYDFVKDRIESLILNNRKMEFIQQLDKDVFQKAKAENRFEIIEFKTEQR